MRRIVAIAVIVAVLAFSLGSEAYARSGHRGRGHRGYGRGYGYGAGVGAVLLGTALAVAAMQPRYYGPVYYNGMPYYTCNGGYYQCDAWGNFYSVQPPVVIQPQPQVIYIQAPTPPAPAAKSE